MNDGLCLFFTMKLLRGCSSIAGGEWGVSEGRPL